jgi:hypothetical protein
MKSKEEFAGKFGDELAGLLVSAFTQNAHGDSADKGRFMMNQLKKAEQLLGRMHDFISGAVPEPPRDMSIETQAADLLTRWSKVGKEAQEKVKDLCRTAFKPVEANGVKK